MRLFLFFAFVSVASLVAEPIWFHNPQEAFAAAAQSRKPVFADVYTTWCHWCKKLDAVTFSHPQFQQVAPQFVLLKVDGDQHAEFCRKYRVTGYPTMLFLNAQGQETYGRVVGFRTADQLVPIMKKAAGGGREDLTWFHNPAEAFAEAAQNGKPVFTDVYTTWCSWCQKLDTETFSHPQFLEAALRFVLLKVDADQNPDFKRKYGVTGYPTMLFLNAQGREIHARARGFRTAGQLVPMMDEVAPGEQYSLAWFHDPAEAFASAQQNGKPVFTDVYTTWCSWCQKLDAETFSHSQFQKVAPRFVLLKVDADQNSDFKRKYNVRGYPTMLFLNAQGQEIAGRVKGFLPAGQLVPIMEKVAPASQDNLVEFTEARVETE